MPNISYSTSDKERDFFVLLEFVNLLINTCALYHQGKCSHCLVNGLRTWPCITFRLTCEPSNTKTGINLEFRTVAARFYINLSFVLFKRKKVEQQGSLDRQRQAGASRVFVICAPHSKALTVAYTNSSDKFKCHV